MANSERRNIDLVGVTQVAHQKISGMSMSAEGIKADKSSKGDKGSKGKDKKITLTRPGSKTPAPPSKGAPAKKKP